jgi:Ni,Fe-hydrogenase I small subunit
MFEQQSLPLLPLPSVLPCTPTDCTGVLSSLLRSSEPCLPSMLAEFQEFNENEDEDQGYFAAYAKLKK